MRVDLRRVARRLQKVIGRAPIFPRSFPQQSQFIGYVCALPAVETFERLRHRRAQSGFAGDAQRGIKRVLIKHMHEPIPQCHRPIRKLLFAHQPHERIHTFQLFQLVFDFISLEVQHLRHYCRIEFVTLHARRHE